MQLFAGKLTEENFDGEKPRGHFDNFWWFRDSLSSIDGENWNEVLFDGIKVTGFTSVAYFLALTFLGNYVINLFLAILLDQFDQEEEEEEEHEREVKKKISVKVHPAASSTYPRKEQDQATRDR